MEQAEPLEAWATLLCCFIPASCMVVSRRWRDQALLGVKELKLKSCALEVALALILARPQLLHLDASKCKALHGDAALAQLSCLLRGRGLSKVRPFLRPGEGRPQHLYLGTARGLTEASCRCLQRLAVQCWAFHAPPKRGTVLVSRPLLPIAGQPEFIRSVILVLQHDKLGSNGILLNQPCKLKLELDLGWDLMQAPVHFGGACGRNLALLHSSPECLEGEELAKGVFLSTDEAKVVSRVRDLLRWKHLQPQEICWFFGHCRWQPGELEAAIQGGYFASAYCDPAFLVPPSTNLWHDLSALLL